MTTLATATQWRRTGIIPRSLLAGLWLIAALPVTIAIMLPLSLLFPLEEMHSNFDPIPLLLFLIHARAGALWARALARMAAIGERKAMIWAGALGIAIPTVSAVMVLTSVEQNLGRYLVHGLQVHQLFAISFALAALTIGVCAGFALGLAASGWRLAALAALSSGFSAALAFTLVAVIMDWLGFRVGAPGAETRATMIVVSILGMWVAGLTASVVIGVYLSGDKTGQTH